jgi:hypothetical protein
VGDALLRAAEARYAEAGYLGLMANLKPEMVEWYTPAGGRRSPPVHPRHREQPAQDMPRITAELERQESVGLGRLPDDLRAFLARKFLVGSQSRA